LGAGLMLCVVLVALLRKPHRPSQKPEPVKSEPAPVVAAVPEANPPPTTVARSNIFHRLPQFSDSEKSDFEQNFKTRYKPAVEKWTKAFAGHVPFSPDDLTLDKFVERVGQDAAYNEYVFVVNGITVGVRDSKGVAVVDYLNAPEQTRKLAQLPKLDGPPAIATPVNKSDVAQMVENESGTPFAPSDIRLTPSGLSGSMNGGVLVSVGGDPERGSTWKYDMAFDPSGNLAYYLKGLR
jgi:hypothetical protein